MPTWPDQNDGAEMFVGKKSHHRTNRRPTGITVSIVVQNRAIIPIISIIEITRAGYELA
jgi:hypothetical protein